MIEHINLDYKQKSSKSNMKLDLDSEPDMETKNDPGLAKLK